jgi:hypothetical protein
VGKRKVKRRKGALGTGQQKRRKSKAKEEKQESKSRVV